MIRDNAIKSASDYSKIVCLDNQNRHGLALSVLESYFHLGEDFEKHTVCLINDRILWLKKRKRVFVYSFEERDLDLLKALQTQAMIYSISKIEGLDKASSFSEIVYDLDEVFNRDSYPNKKKRYNKLTYPFIWLKKNNIKVKMPLPFEVRVLHDTWVKFKLSQPSTYRIMFPTARYLNCYREADKNGFIDYCMYGFYLTNRLISVRVLGLGVNKNTAYDLANFTNTWDTPSQISNYLDVCVLRDLYNHGYKTFNCGAQLNKGLKTFKCHYPYSELKVYSYSRLKKVGGENECVRSFF